LSIIYESTVDLVEYARLGKNNDFPEPDCCPACKGRILLYRHGFYSRNAIQDGIIYAVFIRRLRCPSCRSTCSLLPHFLVPRYQYVFSNVLQFLKEALIGKVRSCYYRLAQYYRRRFIEQLNLVEAFFRFTGFTESLPKGREKATKLLEMVQAASPTFLGRWKDHFSRNFMARSL